MMKNIGFTVPPRMADEFEQVAQEEGSTKSELFRRMFRLYRTYRNQFAKADEIRLDQLVQQAIEGANQPLTAEALEQEEAELLRYGAQKTREVGIGEEEIDDIIYAARYPGSARRS